MFWKLLALIVLATATGSTLLGLRHQQLQIAHETVRLHLQIDRSRKRMWDLQIRIAEHLEPVRLRASIAEAPLDLEPITAAATPVVTHHPASEPVHALVTKRAPH
jgi:cell division protein FtsL